MNRKWRVFLVAFALTAIAAGVLSALTFRS